MTRRDFVSGMHADMERWFKEHGIPTDVFARNKLHQIEADVLATLRGIRTEDRSISATWLELQTTDYALVREWLAGASAANAAPQADERTRFSEEYSNNSNANRLVSARLAELAARRIYEALGEEVQDVSARQVLGGRGWRTHDLLVSGRPVDVKHARGAYANGYNYTEHCVPAFKHERELDVTVAGVFSRYASLDALLGLAAGASPWFTFLGELTQSDLTTQANHFRDVVNVETHSVRRAGGTRFLPAWAFDTGDRLTIACPSERRAQLMDSLRALGSSTRLATIRPHAFALLGFPGLLGSDALPGVPQAAAFTGRVEAARRDVGLTRPVVYLLVLTEILGSLRSGKAPFEYLEQLVFVSSCSNEVDDPNSDAEWAWRWPLGVWDPLMTVRNLLDAFVQAHRSGSAWVGEFDHYRLVGMATLQGRDRAGDWRTVMTHCGGWVKELVPTGTVTGVDKAGGPPDIRSKAKCGNTPLILGSCERCRCGALICPRCGYCRNGCPDVADRQYRVARDR